MTIPDPLLLHSPVEKVLLHYFKSTDALTIFDIGSCDGQDAIRYSFLFPKSSVHSFEPIPDNIKSIQANLERARVMNVRVHALAMSNASGTAMMQVSSGTPDPTKTHTSQSSSLLAPDKHLEIYPWCKFDDELEVKTDTIKHFCQTNSISSVDFIHLDVQGAELMVLEGAGDLISGIKCIWLEVESVSLYKNQPLRKEVESFMHAHNFVLAKFRIGGFSGDQFYVQKDFILAHGGGSSLFYLNLKSIFLRNDFVVLISRITRKIKFLAKRF
jgi:FkbM family methyltransferase